MRNYSHQSLFVSNNLYLLFVIFIIYLCNLKTKVFSTTGTSHWMTDLSVKSITGVTFAGKCPWLMYMICLLTYCFPFFSMIATLFDIAFSIFKLKDFNCSNSFVPLPFIKLGHLGSLTSHMEMVKRCIYR